MMPSLRHRRSTQFASPARSEQARAGFASGARRLRLANDLADRQVCSRNAPAAVAGGKGGAGVVSSTMRSAPAARPVDHETAAHRVILRERI